jgi:RNA polymerase sigma factor (sigma-70 family)
MPDNEEMSLLIERVKPQMIRTAWKLLGHRQDAEDALQDAVLIVHRRWRRIRRHANPAAFVLRICAQAAIDRLRRQSRMRATSSIVPGDEPSVAASGAKHLEREEQRTAIRQALFKLSEKQRAAVIMRFFQDLPYVNIGAALGCGEATARKHVQRALAKLESVLATTIRSDFPCHQAVDRDRESPFQQETS